jgi:anti-anti-sigma regulatory factor
VRPRPPPPPGGPIVVSIEGPIARAGIPALCERVHAALASSDLALVVCDVGGVVRPDVVVVEALARMQLTAMRLGCGFLLRDVTGDLADLLGLMGLAGVLGAVDP